MRKLTLLIISLFVTLGTMAQGGTVVTSLDQLSNDKIYFLESARCFLMYNTTANANGISTSTAKNLGSTSVNKDITKRDFQFLIKKEGENYYLYSVGAAKYVKSNGGFSDTATDALNLKETSNADYKWMLTIGGNGMNSQKPGQMDAGITVNSWVTEDEGNRYRIIDTESVYNPNELAEFNPNRLYTASTPSRGGWAVADDAFCSTSDANTESNPANANQQFAVLTLDNENYYLYSVGAGKFVKSDKSLIAGRTDAIEFADASSQGDYRVRVNFKGYTDKYINLGGVNQMVIDGWSTINEGNAVIFTDAGEFDPTEALEMLQDATITYNFTYEGNVVATKNLTTPRGVEYPNYTLSATDVPYGLIGTEKPQGVVTGDKTCEIALEVNKALPFEAVASGTPTKWYYAQIHGNFLSYMKNQGVGNTIPWKVNNELITAVDEANADSYTWGFVGNLSTGFKVVSKAGGAIKSTGSGNVTIVENIEDATAFIAMTPRTNENAQAENGFCLLNADAGQYINAQNGGVNHWNANDAGSTIIVTEREPVAKIDNNNCLTLAEAAAAAQAGKTIVLLKDTEETLVLPAGVKLDKNGFTAPNVNEAAAKVGETLYASIEAAVDAAQAGDEVVVVADVADVVVDIDKNLTISGSATLNNVGLNANGADALTVKGLDFTGNSWINSGTAEALTISGITANVAPENTSYTNSRSAFISLGRVEAQQLALTVEDSKITVTSQGPDAILGWAAITEATIKNNVLKGSSDGYFNNADAVKFMAIADGAKFDIRGNEIYSNYNGIVFAQNTTRDNAYSVEAAGNKFVGGADHIWIEVSGGDVTHATFNAASDNTVNGNAITANDIKYHSGVIKSWSSYAGIDVVTDADGKVIGGTLASFSNEESLADGFVFNDNGDGTYGVQFASYIVLPEGVDSSNYAAKFGDNTVTDGTNYYATLQAAVEAVVGQPNAVLYCKPGADVGSLQHAPVTSTLTVYGNGADVTGGAERDFDLSNTDPSFGNDITADMTLTVKHLNGCGAWGAKATEHTVNLVFENCANMGKVFITGTTGTLNITMTDCAFEGVINEAVYSNADGAITLTNVAFSNLNKAVNLNHKAAGTQTVTIDGCTFTDCGADVAADQIPVRVLSSVEGGKSLLTVTGSTFTGTPEGGADILLDYGVGLTTASVSGTAANVVVEKEHNVGTTTAVKADETVEFTTALPVAQVGETKFMTLAEAVADATEGATITMLADVTLTETVTLPAGITFNGNGKAVNGEVWAAGNLTFVGHTKVANFNAGYNKPVITIGEGACLELTGTGRMVIGHGATFNITGSIEDAKTADVAALTPSLIIPGASFTGAGVTFNVTNAYIKATAYCSSKNSNASGTHNFNITNSIWEQTGSFVFTEPTNGMDPTFNLNFKDGVLNSTSHLVFAVTKGEIVFDNSNVNGEDARRQIENRSQLTVKNGSVVYGAVATSSNAKNPGTLIVEDATYAVTGEFSGSDLGTGTLIVKKGATVSAGSITKANIQIDATGMEPGEVAINANLTNFAGTLEVINNDLFEAAVVDGKIVLSSKSLAGEGTEAAPFVIDNLDDLRLFAMSVNAGNNYAGKYVKLGASVDLSAQAVALMSTEVTPNWEPIGTKDAPFKGTFDGNGETISNMIVVGEANQGFFGYADAATIKNLNLVNVTVTGTDCVGAVAGQVYSVSLIDNCHVSGNIKVEGQTNVGGITGKYYTKVSNCSVIGDGAETSYVKGVYVASDFEGDNIGGIMGHCGENNNLAGNTVKNITVSGTRKVGGIVGIADQNTDVTGCVVENVVVETTATADYADSKVTSMSIAALIGQYQAAGSNPDGTVTGCTVKNVTFNNVNDVTVDVGPIVGGARGGSSGMLAPSTAVTASGNNVYMTTITGSTNDYLMVAVAKIGEKNYYVLDEAFAAAQAGETVTLVNNVALETPVVISGKALTLDLGACTIEDKSTAVLTKEDDVWALIDLENGANLTVRGTGTIKANYANVQGGWTGMAYCINVDNTSKLTVDGGNFINGNGGVQTLGEVVVNGGTFVSHNGGTCIFATYTDAKVTVNGGTFKDSVEESDLYTGSGAVWAGFGAKIEINGGTFDFAADPENGNVVWTLFPAQNAIAGYGVNAEMAVSGGTFVNFNPAEDVVVDYSPSTGFTFGSVVAEGYTVVANADGTYSVADAAIEVTDAEGNVTYIANTKGFNTSNVTLKLMKDVAGYNLNLNKATGVVFDLNGYTFAKQINLNNGAELTIKDTSAEKTGKVIVNQETNDTFAAIVIMRGTLTVEGGTIETTGTTGAIQASMATLNINGGKIVSAGNGVELGTWAVSSTKFPNNVTMTDGEIVAAGVGIKDSDKCTGTTIVITGGKINSTGECLDVNTGEAAVSGGTFSKEIAEKYCAEGYVCKANGDGTYSVVEKVELPEVVITDIKGSLTDSDPDLTFALNFAIKDVESLTDEYLEKLFAQYGDWYTDYVLTISGLTDEDVTFNANGGADGYLSGQYDAWSKNWVSVPFEDVTLANNESIYIMEYAAKLMNKQGLRFTLREVAEIVQNFDCGVYFTPEFLAANPGMKVDLQLKVFTEDAEGNKVNDINVATNNFDIEDYVAIVHATGKQTQYCTTLADAVAAADGATITMLRNVELTEAVKVVGKAITLDLNGKTVSGVCNSNQGYLVYIENGAGLTVKDGAVDGGGKLTYAKGTSNVGWTVDVEGAFTLEAGTVELTGDDWSIGYAVDVRPNSWGTEYTNPSVFTMNGGNVVSSDGAVRVASSSADQYANVSASFVMNGGEIDAAWDGVFIQQSNTAYDVLNFTINNGTIKSGLNPVRVYGPAPTSYVNGQECMSINFNGGTMTYTGTETREWIIDGVLRVGGGSSIETIVENGNITASEAFAQAQALPEGYIWEQDGETYKVVEAPKDPEVVDGKIEFIDGEFDTFVNAENVANVDITYKRTLRTSWVALYVPFKIPMSMLAENFEVAYFNDVHSYDDDHNGTIDRMSMELVDITNSNATLRANYPYFIRAKSAENTALDITLEDATLYADDENSIDCTSMYHKFEITGTHKRMTRDELGDRRVVNTEGEWVYQSPTGTLKPFRFYLTITNRDGSPVVVSQNAQMSIVVRGEDGYTGVEGVENENGEDMIFDLQGRRVLEPEKGGLYIINGKKVLVK